MTTRLSVASLALPFALIASTVSVVGCSAPGSADEAQASTASAAGTQRYDGATIFRGLIFGVGPVAAELPEIWGKADKPFLNNEQAAEAFAEHVASLKLSPEQEKAAAQLGDLIRAGKGQGGDQGDEVAKLVMAEIARKDPSFFDKFGKYVKSGNPVAVDKILKETDARLSEIVFSPQGDVSSRLGEGWALNRNRFINLQLHRNININFQWDRACFVDGWWAVGLDRLNKLRNEVVVAELTQRMAGF